MRFNTEKLAVNAAAPAPIAWNPLILPERFNGDNEAFNAAQPISSDGKSPAVDENMFHPHKRRNPAQWPSQARVSMALYYSSVPDVLELRRFAVTEPLAGGDAGREQSRGAARPTSHRRCTRHAALAAWRIRERCA